MPRICDYEGSNYRTEFWEGRNRRYEDLAERIALKRMLPPTGYRIIEVGAGFGRLADLYQGYRQIVLVDYAQTQLEEARRYLGDDPRYLFVAADVYNLPFNTHAFNALVMVRVMHHLVNIPAALTELHRLVNPGGVAVIEHANKRHLKAILRWLLKRQTWNPFDPTPHEFVDLNIDFHPKWMRRQFTAAGFVVQATRTVSHYRLPWLKKQVPASVLATFDGWLQPTGRWWQYTPSIFLQAAPRPTNAQHPVTPPGLFRCPACGSPLLDAIPNAMRCQGCGHHWPVENGIYNFKYSLPNSVK